ncbi:MAG: dTDP-4-dehydrorhamnose reductase [Myxococcaceae bacterium]
MKLLVTGANGLVGSRLSALAAGKGHDVLALGRGPKRFAADVAYASVDLTDATAVNAALARHRPDAVVHPASMTEVDRCEKDPLGAYAGNVTATENVAKACREHGAHLVHVSTDYVFDGNHGPYSETDTPNPRGVYAITKYMAEQAVQVLAPSWSIARTAVVFGWPPSARPNFGSWLYETLKGEQPVKLFEDQFVSPSLASNVAAMLGELAERKLTGIWNICGADVVNRVSFGEAMCKVFGLDAKKLVPTKLKDLNLASPRPLRSGLKVDKAREALSVKPFSLGEALARFREETLR